jgi:PAS domain S-box-containing protein
MAEDQKHAAEKFETILDSINDGVYTVDLNWRVTYFNRSAELITGTPREEAVGQSCFEVFRSSVCETGCLIRETLATRQALVNKPIYIVRADKRRIPISATTTLLKTPGGSVAGGVVTFRDLTAMSKLRKELSKRHTFEDIVSKNVAMHRIFAVLPLIAKSLSTVLIQGPSGTGKELIARAIHNNSPHTDGPFVAVNCGALPDTLVESELFGYMAGAFTDARRDKPGRFAQAQNGSLLLDEIGDISPAMQVRLLRVLETRSFEPLGATRSVATNARIMAATHQDLDDLVAQGRFRQDLYYRLNIVRLSLPAIAERREDIPLLVNHFVERFNSLTGKRIVGVAGEAMAALMFYAWPGNVRELENAIEHAFVLCEEELIGIQHLPGHVLPTGTVAPIVPGATLKAIEKRAIQQALERNQGKKMVTARELGISKNTLRRKLKRYQIEPGE